MTETVRPVGWADVATKQDLLEARFASVDSRLAALETRRAKIEDKLDDISRELRAQTWKFHGLDDRVRRGGGRRVAALTQPVRASASGTSDTLMVQT